jgi:uncharacterized protein (TIGR03086 family)
MDSRRRELHRTALDVASEYVVAVARPALQGPTPCAGWTLGDLLAHMIGQHRGITAAVRDGNAPASAYTPVPFTEAGWHDSASELIAAFNGVDLDATVVEIELAPMPISVRRILDAHVLDTVIHTWDVAEAEGREFTPPTPLLTAVRGIADGIPDRAHGPGAPFAPRLPAPGTTWADTLALVGRNITKE